MASFYGNILEEELKNKVAADWFAAYDCTQIIGKIDFAVAVPKRPHSLSDTEYLLWAEAKQGTSHDITEAFIQLILTIGRARTYEQHLPPAFLGAFDAEKIAFVHYSDVMQVFVQNDFNWNVPPSDHSSREFRQLNDLLASLLNTRLCLFRYAANAAELRAFIKANMRTGSTGVRQVQVTINNFTHVYNRWLAEVKPTIAVHWDKAKQSGLIDADFFLADLLSKDNATLQQKLNVLLKGDEYIFNRTVSDIGFLTMNSTGFNDNQQAHTRFWNRYQRPPRRKYWDKIVERRDLLVPQDVRERKGSYFTPRRWVELSQEYLARALGEDWQEKYYVWDCCAGTGNLLAGLTNKYNIYASTLDRADIDVIHQRIATMNAAAPGGSNLLDAHVFQFDFLNDPFLLDSPEQSKLPASLIDILRDPDKRSRLVIYINPPYAEASDVKTLKGGKGKNAVEQSEMNKKYAKILGQGNAELFVQFFTRVYDEIRGAALAEFSKLKILQGPHFSDFRTFFKARLDEFFVIPANTFDNVSGHFPIGFMVWRLDGKNTFTSAVADVYDRNGTFLQKKTFQAYDHAQYMNSWAKPYRGVKEDKDIIGKFPFKGNDFQNQDYIQIVAFLMSYNNQAGQFIITKRNVVVACVYFAVRKTIQKTWLNDRDQFLCPNEAWASDADFQADCLAYTLFSNNIQSQYGPNNWIPFTEAEVGAQEVMPSHFMADFIAGRDLPQSYETAAAVEGHLPLLQQAAAPQGHTPALAARAEGQAISFSPEAQAVMTAGRDVWSYYHAQPDADPNAALYDIRLRFQGTKTTPSGRTQMRPDSDDAEYSRRIASLRTALKALAARISPKVYAYGFLRQ